MEQKQALDLAPRNHPGLPSVEAPPAAAPARLEQARVLADCLSDTAALPVVALLGSRAGGAP